MDLMKVGKTLSNKTRLRLLQLIADEPDSAIGAHQRYVDRYNDQKHRESIYRSLETLVDAQLLTKEYQKEEGLVYQLAHEQLLINLQEASITPISQTADQEGD